MLIVKKMYYSKFVIQAVQYHISLKSYITVFNILVSCSIQIVIHTAYSLKLHTLTCTCNLEIIILCCS